MADTNINPETIAKLAKAVAFISGPQHETTLALQAAVASGKPADIKKAYALFLKLNSGHRQAALAMISG